MSSNHSWRFFRAGGFDQVKLETGADLQAIDELDQKLWVALACPTTGLEFDLKTLALIDSDKDGRIRALELIAAVKWAGSCLKNPDDLLKSSPSLELSAINDATPEGKQLLSSARQILSNLGKKDATSITVEETSDTAKIFAQTQFNGDGIVPADSTTDVAIQALIKDIIACLGSDVDRSSKPGVNQAKVDQFFAEAQAFSDWWKKAESDSALLPLGAATAAASATLKVVKAKVDDYFARCRLAAFDPRALTALNREEKEYLAMAARDLTLTSVEIACFPIAQVAPAKPLPLKDGINPAWSDAMAKFQAEVVRPLGLDKPSINESDWALITTKFAAFDSWNSSKAGTAVEKLGLARVREILAGKGKETVTSLIAKDKALEPEANAIALVDKLVRFNANLYRLVNNFVSFRDFYQRRDKAIFQIGTLYLDQRSCELCLPVEDAGKHATMAALAGSYLAYCDCVRKGTGEKRQIVAAFTGGDSDNLMVGRNGIFYDRKGLDWDATITKIVDNPISIRQAFWSPYKKFVRMVEEQIAKRAAAADAAASDRLAQTASQVARVDQPPPAPAAKPAEPKKLDVGVVAALGVAVGAIGGALASFATGIMKLEPWQIPVVFAALIFLISFPSMVIAWLKLRRRNLGPILDANGWAVNARAMINVPFGGSLTKVAALPSGSQRDLFDPFAEKKSQWPKVIAAVVVLWIIYAILNNLGFINEWTNGRLGTAKSTRRSTEQVIPSAPAVEAKPAEAAK
jgi:hypothetical protein